MIEWGLSIQLSPGDRPHAPPTSTVRRVRSSSQSIGNSAKVRVSG
jgi:hypothetical protein